MVALIPKYEPRQVVQAQAPVPVRAAQTSLGDLAAGVEAVGNTLDQFQDEIDTADAKTADADLANFIREQLYGDQNGYMYATGSDAINRRQTVAEAIEARRNEIFQALSPSARAKARTSLQARGMQSLQNIDQHAAGQRITYLNTASQARIEMARQDAIFDPSKIDASIRLSRSEVLDQAERNGWSPEQTALALQGAGTRIHEGVIERTANVDPVRAMEYLKDNRDRMSGESVARLESALTPMIRERRGRDAGRAAATESFITYSNLGAVRDDPVSNELASAMSFLPAMGITMEVFSGGQAAAGTPGEQRVGSTRHDHGNAADVFFYKDGRKLSWENPNDVPIYQEIVRRARAAGLTGFGAGPGYMRGGSMHIGFGDAAVWGAGGKGENAPAWLVEAFTSDAPLPDLPDVQVGGGIESLLNIADPDERAAAIAEYNLITGVQRAQRQRVEEAAQDAVFQHIEGGGAVDDLPLDIRQGLGQEAMNSLRTYQSKIAAGDVIRTDDTTYVNLMDMSARQQEVFKQQDLLAYRDQLSDSDFQYFLKLQRDMRTAQSDGPGPTVARLNRQADRAVEGLGLDTADRAPLQGRVTRHLMEWAQRNPELAENEFEVYAQAQRALAEVVIDRTGPWNTRMRSMDIDLSGRTLTTEDDVDPQELASAMANGDVSINGVQVEPRIFESVVADLRRVLGRDPMPSELLEAIVARAM